MMGAAAARHLSKKTDGIALIGPGEPADPKTHQGVFASHYDEARITRTIDPDPVWALLANRSIARYREIEEKSGIRFYHRTGCLMVAPERASGHSYLRNICEAAETWYRYRGAAPGRAFPGISPILASSRVARACWRRVRRVTSTPGACCGAELLAERQGVPTDRGNSCLGARRGRSRRGSDGGRSDLSCGKGTCCGGWILYCRESLAPTASDVGLCAHHHLLRDPSG